MVLNIGRVSLVTFKLANTNKIIINCICPPSTAIYYYIYSFLPARLPGCGSICVHTRTHTHARTRVIPRAVAAPSRAKYMAATLLGLANAVAGQMITPGVGGRNQFKSVLPRLPVATRAGFAAVLGDYLYYG